ncbi:hypothetical protein OG21DRAFT_1380036, partial [Imleria badia]
MALPKNTPTLEALAMKNWTRPDNIFCTEITAKYLTHCYTDPARRGPRTDHVPILTTLDLHTPHSDNHPTHNYNDVDWKKFNETLALALAPFPTNTPIVTEQDFQRTARGVTDAILSTIDAHVPFSRPSLHAKRWWTRTKELSDMRKETNKLTSTSFQCRAIPDHPSHKAHCIQCNRY